MDISVLVTVKNDLQNVNKLIQSLKSQGGEFELVIVDANSTDGTFEYLESEEKNFVMVLGKKDGNRSVGRNECIRLSKGNKLVFIDSDSEVPDSWIVSLKKYLGKDIVAGEIYQKSELEWTNLGRVPMFYEGTDVTHPTNNLMISRYVIDKTGLFDERFNTAEDIDMNIRAIKNGFKIFYAKDVYIYHHPRTTYFSMMKQSFYDGAGRKLIKRKHNITSRFNIENLREHPIIEISRLIFGLLGYVFGV